MTVLSADFGGSHIGCAVVHNKQIRAEVATRHDARSFAAALAPLAEGLHSCVRQSGIPLGEIAGLAIGYCGVVDSATNEILSTLDKYADAPDIDLAAWSRAEFGLPVRMENDARLALLGEAWAGAAQGRKDVVMVTLGTGIGGAAMLGGRLLHSRSGQAGTLGGHLPVKLDGRLCVCGAVGCAEAEASTAVLPALCAEHPLFAQSALAHEPRIDFVTLFRALDAGDRVAQEVFAHCLEVWSALTVGLIHAYGPELVLFGGGVLQRREMVLPGIRRYVERHVWRSRRGLPAIRAAMHGRHAALLGGEALFSGGVANV